MGILILSKQSFFTKKRKSDQRLGCIDREALAKSLRKEEYQELASTISGEVPAVPNGQMFSKCREIILEAEEDMLSKSYITLLKKYRSVNLKLIKSLPASLKNAAVSYRFTPEQELRLVSLF